MDRKYLGRWSASGADGYALRAEHVIGKIQKQVGQALRGGDVRLWNDAIADLVHQTKARALRLGLNPQDVVREVEQWEILMFLSMPRNEKFQPCSPTLSFHEDVALQDNEEDDGFGPGPEEDDGFGPGPSAPKPVLPVVDDTGEVCNLSLHARRWGKYWVANTTCRLHRSDACRWDMSYSGRRSYADAVQKLAFDDYCRQCFRTGAPSMLETASSSRDEEVASESSGSTSSPSESDDDLLTSV